MALSLIRSRLCIFPIPLKDIVPLTSAYCTRSFSYDLHTPSDVGLREPSDRLLKSISRIKQKDGSIVIEGRNLEQESRSLLLDHKGACPLCNMDIEYTDVLILRQFVRKDGGLLPRRDTGLCAKQQIKVAKLVHKAANAGLLNSHAPLLPNGKTRRPAKESKYKFKGLNRYFTNKY